MVFGTGRDVLWYPSREPDRVYLVLMIRLSSLPAAPGLEMSGSWWERLLLALELGTDGEDAESPDAKRQRRSLRDWIVDFVLFSYAVFSAAATAGNDQLQVGHALLVLNVVLAVPACLLVWMRRRYPVSVGWLVVGLSALSSSAIHACMVAVFSAAIHARPRRAVELTAGAIAATAVDCTIFTGLHGQGVFNASFFAFWSATTIAAFGLGSFVRVRRELVCRLHSEQRLRIHEAQLAERARIAREMHDVLAHRISLLSVHAGALEYNRDASPEEVARGLSVIRSSARAAQEELRAVIGVLRSEAGEDPVRPPQPTIDDLEQLLEESRGAGMEVSLTNALSERTMSTQAGRTVYRILQEALTNARKHAPTQPVSVSIAAETDRTLRIAVVNRPESDETRPLPELADHVGSGTGLIGLAERISLSGGTFEHQRLAGGGFELTARIPLTSPAAKLMVETRTSS
jgi:signal transduction histidine kinase